MSKFTIEKVQQLYDKVKDLAKDSFRKGNWNEALTRIDLAANIGYTFNHIYTDADLEEMLFALSENIISKKSDFIPKKDRFVFYDSFGFSNRGLVHQYIRSLISWDVDFLYICGSYNLKTATVLINEIEEYSKSKVFILDNKLKKTEQIKILHNQIYEFNPANAFLYLNPWDVVAITTFYALPKIKRFQINLTDHTFWLGVGCLDYTLEFRNYGCTISEQKRGIKRSKILLQPFYPIIIPSKFKGFPKEVTSDKVVIFSGGAYYKIYGDNDKFFFILKRLLEINPNVIILFAGWGEDKPFKQFIKNNHYESRIILLGFRNDINELFVNSDIYLGTYPVCGGLMSQYAAINGKPILAYTKNGSGGNLEELILHNPPKNGLILTHSELDEFFLEAKILIEKKSYRESIGLLLRDCVISPEQFNSELHTLITKHQEIRKFKSVFVNYELNFEQNLEIENKYQKSIGFTFFSRLNLSALKYFPFITLKLIPTLIYKYNTNIVRKLIKNIW